MKKIVIASIAAMALVTAASAAVNGKACVACHGAHWEKHAMGKSKVVAEMSHADIAAALKGYKDGTYGGPMKGVMKGQVARYSDADLEAFAQTIGK
jgi:cytochrome c-type protein NapB